MSEAVQALVDRDQPSLFEGAVATPSAPIAATRLRGASAEPEIILDLSRLLSRVRFSAPTGVDRVEMAYARRLLQVAPERLSFAAVHPCGLYGRLPIPAVATFLEETERTWRGEGRPAGWGLTAAATLGRLMPKLRPEPIAPRARPRAYLQVSPHHLDRPRQVRAILARERARFVCLVHDLIPIDYPEYARPNGQAEHRRRIATVVALADGVIAASEATRRSYLAHLGREGRTAEVRVAPLGAEGRQTATAPLRDTSDKRPYFVAVGTIEPRKNHLLLLNLWRRLVEERGASATPRLVLVGRRGWENENILDMLDRCPALKDVVEERGHLSDREMWPLVQGARALLMPSFAEGFGLPVIEALQMGAPVLCSGIDAHREIAGGVADFLDPQDGPGWRRAVLDYADPDSRRRGDQIRRLAGWRAPTWEAHVGAALDLIAEITQ